MGPAAARLESLTPTERLISDSVRLLPIWPIEIPPGTARLNTWTHGRLVATLISFSATDAEHRRSRRCRRPHPPTSSSTYHAFVQASGTCRGSAPRNVAAGVRDPRDQQHARSPYSPWRPSSKPPEDVEERQERRQEARVDDAGDRRAEPRRRRRDVAEVEQVVQPGTMTARNRATAPFWAVDDVRPARRDPT